MRWRWWKNRADAACIFHILLTYPGLYRAGNYGIISVSGHKACLPEEDRHAVFGEGGGMCFLTIPPSWRSRDTSASLRYAQPSVSTGPPRRGRQEFRACGRGGAGHPKGTCSAAWASPPTDGLSKVHASYERADVGIRSYGRSIEGAVVGRCGGQKETAKRRFPLAFSFAAFSCAFFIR